LKWAAWGNNFFENDLLFGSGACILEQQSAAGGFNPPFTPSFWKTNEVYIDVLENDVVQKLAAHASEQEARACAAPKTGRM
jgi:hypothetical protein